MNLALLAIASYFLGAIPFGMIVARRHGLDIFATGSGNPGATNVMRTLGTGPGLLVLFLDVLKGVIPSVAARWITPEQWIWCAIGFVAVLGHSFSPFVRFKGGKGISTALGATIGSAPLVAAAAFGVFVIALAVTRYVSVASTLATASTILWIVVIPGQSRWLLMLYGLLVLLVVWRHRANYKRLLKGEEPKFKFKKSPPKPPQDSGEPDTAQEDQADKSNDVSNN